MPPRTVSSSGSKRPKAATPEGRERQLTALAVDLAEKQLSEGTASAQVITHFLKLATAREERELEKLTLENELLKARTEQIASQARVEELYVNALNAMKSYSGSEIAQDG